MIRFEQISYKNFISAGNDPLVVSLCKSPLNLITGKNGQGKSVIGESICYALYGKAYRNINNPQLINSINGKNCLVEIKFSVGTSKIVVKRGMKPTIFEIWQDGKQLNQNPNAKDFQKYLEQQILKMNYRAFTQVVVMGTSNYVPFMELKPNARREFIEEILDIRVFSVMNVLLKDKVKFNKDSVTEINTELKSLKDKAQLLHGFIEKQSSEKKANITLLEEELDELLYKRDTALEKSITISKEIELFRGELTKYNDLNDTIAHLRATEKQFKESIDTHTHKQHFYSTAEECPTCCQPIDPDIKYELIEGVTKEIDQWQSSLEKIQLELSAAWERVEKVTDIQEKINILRAEYNKEDTLHSQYGNEWTALCTKIKNARQESNVKEETNKLKELANKILTLDKEKRGVLTQAQYHNAMLGLLQDTGIKSKIIKQYVPVINKLVNKFLDKLDFFAQFTLDENFNETVLSRHRDNFTWASFSEGQKTRISLALMFTWRELAKMKNSVSTNLVFFDELLDSAMDHNGLDLALSLLGDMHDSNIFVISHRESALDKYPNVLNVTMRNNFSVIEYP